MYPCFCFYILLKRLVVNVSYISIFVLISCSSLKIFLITDFRENWRFMFVYVDIFRHVSTCRRAYPFPNLLYYSD